MLRVTLRSFWEHKRRLISTVLAVVLGVAFMAGTFVLSDTLDKVFDDLFAEGGQNVDAQVQGEVIIEDPFMGDQRAFLDESLVATVAVVDGVRVAEPRLAVFGFGSVNRVLDAEGDAVGASQGPPTILENWVDGSTLTNYVLADGRGPETDDEIALNVAAVDEGDFAIGQSITIISQFGPKEYSLVGTILFGDAESSAGAVSAQMTLPEVQRLAGAEGKVQGVLAAAEDGISQRQLADAIAAAVPEGSETLTGEEASAQLSSDVQEGFQFFQVILTVFAGIALLVGAFVISNTFAILVAQRTRELALLRAVGASRGQVMLSVLVEAVLIGLVSAAIGLAAGVGLAKAVTSAFAASGADLPTTNLVLRPFTVALAFVIGLGVTLVAALVPAIKATRVPPLAALRDVAIDRSGVSKPRIAIGVIALLLGLLNVSAAWTTDDTGDALGPVGLGAVLIIVAAIVIGPVLAGPSVRTIGAWLPRLRGVNGRLAKENAARSPKRTSATASALIIGVALITFITVLAASATKSIEGEVNRGLTGDFVVQSEGLFTGGGGFPSSVAGVVSEVPGVDLAIPLGFTSAEFTYPDGDSNTQQVTFVDPERVTEVFEPKMAEGGIEELTDGGVIIDVGLAEDEGLALGDEVTMLVAGGGSVDLEVEAISDDITLLGFTTVTRRTVSDVLPQVLDIQVFGTVEGGADLEEVMAAIEEATADTPSIEVLDREGLVGALAGQITSFVTVIYALLVLSIIIAMIGIANTLSLSIHERVRELGLLRAVGMDRGQLRSSIRWEAVLISMLGGLVGIVLGVFLSWALVTALGEFGLGTFALPVGSLVFIVAAAALLGTLASIRPARRASKLPILAAISTE